ncbi:hypothetical protein GIB67_034974, partial [Kingdonia uniflora]
KVCLSYRCADMDREIPALMGISKAILENVIFVHQNDANWPLQDPSTLKKKFDDIFFATRSTSMNFNAFKCYDLQLRESISQDQDRSESLKTQIQELERNIQKVESRIQHTETTLKDLKNIQDQISVKTATRSTLFTLQQTQYAALDEENEDTDEELKEWQSKFGERIKGLGFKIRKLSMEMDDIGEIKKSKIDVVGNSNLEIGKLQQAADEHMSLKHDRDCTIQNVFLKHNLGCLPPTPFSNEVTFNLMNRVKTRLTDLENDLKDKKVDQKSNATELQSIWDSYVAVNQCYSDLGRRVLRCMKEKEKERDMAELQLSNFNLSHVDEKEKTLHMEIERKMRLMAEKQFEENIQKNKIEFFSLTQKYNALSRGKDVMTSDFEYTVKLDLKKGEIDSRRKHHKKNASC